MQFPPFLSLTAQRILSPKPPTSPSVTKHDQPILLEWLAVKVSYIQVGSKCDPVIFTSSDQRSLRPFGMLRGPSQLSSA
jgi:hypothetical protein